MYVHCIWPRSRSPFLLRFDKSAAQSGATLQLMHPRFLPNSNLLKCEASHREAVSTIFKIFGMTRSRKDQNPRPPPNSKRTLYNCTIESVYIQNIITVGENIIATTKIRNHYGAIQPFIFPTLQYWTFLYFSL